MGANVPGRHVLVADDDETVRARLRRILERAGHQVAEADNGYAALDLARKSTFDLVIIDLIMPEMDGLVTIRELRNLRVTSRIIAISAASHAHYLDMARLLGADATLAKPLDDLELMDLVRRVLQP